MLRKILIILSFVIIFTFGLVLHWQFGNIKRVFVKTDNKISTINIDNKDYFEIGTGTGRELLSTEGWKEYKNDLLSFEYPSNFVVKDSNFDEYHKNTLIKITEIPDSELEAEKGNAYTPDSWTEITVFKPIEIQCSYDNYGKCGDKNKVFSLSGVPATDWQDMFAYLDGQSPKKTGTVKVMINNKIAVHQWYFLRQGIEGYPISQSDLEIKLDDSNLLFIVGDTRKYKDADIENRLSIIETIYSTIKFK